MDNFFMSHHQSGYDNIGHSKFGSLSKRASIDSAYDSILFTSQNSPSSNSFFSNSSHNNTDYFNCDTNGSIGSSSNSNMFSQPATPVKSGFIYNGNNMSTTPDFKQQYVADINGFYFASIRQSSSTAATTATPSSCSSYTSPFKSSSNSPAKYCSVDSFVHKRDTFSTKLLRSPAFKIEQNCVFNSPNRSHPYQQIETTPTKPFIKSFSSRFQSNLNLQPPEPIIVPPKPTPTEEEFMEMLIANHHIPDNPEFLIGRHMGLENVDILSELNKRSMNTIVEKVFSFLSVSDCVRVGCVSKEWRSLIKQDIKRNKERTKLIKSKKLFYETYKENCFVQLDIQKLEKRLLNSNLNQDTMTMDSPKKMPSASVSASQRRSLYKLTCEQVSLRQNIDSDLNGSQFKMLDVNCMENLYNNITQSALKQNIPVKIVKSPVKKERLSPAKRCLKEDHLNTSSTGSKIDLICSKKSKKNLKRL